MFRFRKKKKGLKLKDIRTLLITFTLLLFVISPSLPALALSDLYGITASKQIVSKKLTMDSKDDECAEPHTNPVFENREDCCDTSLKRLLPFVSESVFSLKAKSNKINNVIFMDVYNTPPFLIQRLLL